MKANARHVRHERRKTENASWEDAVDMLAMHLCPADEWREYEQQLQRIAWSNTIQAPAAGKSGRPFGGKTATRSMTPTIKVFPVWRKYRAQARRVATLYRAVPILRILPLCVTGFLGDVLFK